MGENQKKYRVQLDFDQQGLDELEALKAELRAGSRADTVRYGLGLLRWAVSQLKGGAKILVEKEGDLSGVVFPFLPTQQLKAEPGVVTLRRESSARGQGKDINLEDLLRKAREHAVAEESHYETDRG